MIPKPDLIKTLLDRKAFEYNRIEFIPEDPISIPHRFSVKEDIEIAGFLTAIISWGQRKTIIKNSLKLMDMMDFNPYQFIMNSSDKELNRFIGFRHRTFNGEDCVFFLKSLKNIYLNHNGLESVFTPGEDVELIAGLMNFRRIFLSVDHPRRSSKHIADPSRGASAKRINMFLRWMVRRDSCGVDFGLWKNISPASLYCPLDVHTGKVARKLGILTRNQDDWKAVIELTDYLRDLDPSDPIRYDFALFGMGLHEGF